jgi:two-component system OmpR family sensor kinase
VGLVAVACVIVAMAIAPEIRGSASIERVHLVLTLVAAAVGAAAAILGDIAARLTGDARPTWIATALVLYTLFVVPSTFLLPTSGDNDSVIRSVRLVALLAVVVLLVVATSPPRRLGPGGAWAIAAVTALAIAAAGESAVIFKDLLNLITSPPVVTVALMIGWCLVAAGLVLAGRRRSGAPLWQVGLGLLAIAGAHLYRVTAGVDVLAADLLFDGVRLLGLVVVLVGMAHLVACGVRALRDERFAHDEELRIATAHMRRATEKAAERDHELRNGLAGLAGITELLGSPDPGPEHERLRSAVLRELARLAAIVDRPEFTAPVEGYDVGLVLSDVIALRNSAGAVIHLSAAPGLRATGSPAVLTQVVTNLLENCARHAPGSPVSVSAGACGLKVIIEVSDSGPGIAPGQERLVLERGARHPVSGGSGLGLHVSQQLLAGEGGSLRVLPLDPAHPGCTVVVELPRVLPDPDPDGDVDLPRQRDPSAMPAVDLPGWNLPDVDTDPVRRT